MNNKKYPIIHISRHRIDSDGEGVRTLLLVEGCSLRCRYCINPYTWNGSCKADMLTAAEIYDKIKIDRPYMLATNGGISFGGGEPLHYPRLINEMRDICDEDMTIYVETSLYVPWENIESVSANVDRFYVDIKSMDPSVYKQYTGKELDLAKQNLIKLIRLRGCDSVVVRVPEIPGYADKNSQKRSEYVLKELGIQKIKPFKYHTFLNEKYNNIKYN